MSTEIPDSSSSVSPIEARAPFNPAEPRARLSRARILVVGVEPWGAAVAEHLAAAGASALHVVDSALVSEDDLLATRLFAGAERGAPRASALSAALSRRYPGCRITSGPLLAAAGQPLSLEDTGWDLVLTCVHIDELLVLRSVARFAHAAGVPSLTAHLDGLDAVIGPGVVPGRTACWSCAHLRTLATRHDARVDAALSAQLLSERPAKRTRTYLAPMPALVGHALALAALDLLMSPGTALIAGRLFVQNLVRLTTSIHAVLPMPWCDVCGGARAALAGGASLGAPGVRLDAAESPEALRRLLAGVVDARTGIIKHLSVGPTDASIALETPLMGTAVMSASTRCAHHGLHGEPEVGSGKGLTAVQAMLGAVGEAVERYSAERIDTARLSRAPVAEMTADFIDPARLCLYSEAQYARPGFPYEPLSPTTPIDWVEGYWLDTRLPVEVPALPVFFNYPAPREEYFCQVTSNGLAAGPTLDDASMHAALELIERDAFMISWLARRPGRRVVLDGALDPGAREIVRQLAGQGARIELYLLDAGLDVPAVMCVAFGDGERWPGATVSLSAHLSPRVAVAKAILEQGQGGPYIRRMMEEGKRAIPAEPEDVHSLEDHALYYVPPRRAEAFTFLAQGGEVSLSALDEPEDLSLGALVRRLQGAGLRIAIVDVTSPDLLGTPFRVARAVGPDFQQIHFGHLVARLGNPRLLAMARGGLNPDPQPMD